MIKAVIVDDEPYCCESLATLLERYCPAVKVADICYSGEAALLAIKEQQPQIVFLDIEMASLNEVNKYIKGEGGYLIMSDDSSIDVSRTRKEMLLKKLLPGKYT